MELLLERFSSGSHDTLGILYELNGQHTKSLCFTLEDQHQDIKVKDETRIPAGRYELKLRTVGGTHERYSKMFPSSHIGMLWLQDVPGFEYILIHIGNTHEDSSGCILVGDDCSGNVGRDGSIARSRDAYSRIYMPIASEIFHGNPVWITVSDRA